MTTSEGTALSPTTGHTSDQTPNGAPPLGGRYNSADYGWTLAMELVTATFVWGGIGWLGDRWLGTRPLLMVIGFLLGNGLGIYLIWLRSNDRFVQEHAELMTGRGGPGERRYSPPPLHLTNNGSADAGAPVNQGPADSASAADEAHG